MTIITASTNVSIAVGKTVQFTVKIKEIREITPQNKIAGISYPLDLFNSTANVERIILLIINNNIILTFLKILKLV